MAALRPLRVAGTLAEAEEAYWTMKGHMAVPLSTQSESVVSSNGHASMAAEVMEGPSPAPVHSRPST